MNASPIDATDATTTTPPATDTSGAGRVHVLLAVLGTAAGGLAVGALLGALHGKESERERLRKALRTMPRWRGGPPWLREFKDRKLTEEDVLWAYELAKQEDQGHVRDALDPVDVFTRARRFGHDVGTQIDQGAQELARRVDASDLARQVRQAAAALGMDHAPADRAWRPWEVPAGRRMDAPYPTPSNRLEASNTQLSRLFGVDIDSQRPVMPSVPPRPAHAPPVQLPLLYGLPAPPTLRR